MHMSNTCTHVNGNKNMGLTLLQTIFHFHTIYEMKLNFSSNICSFNDALQYMQQYLSYID